jgi:hypothetical protein
MSTQKIREKNLGGAAAEVARSLDLRERVRQHPYGTLAAVAGVGYVLAGGLLTRLTARAVRLGLGVGAQLAVWPLLEKELRGLAAAFKAERAARAPEVGLPSPSNHVRASTD